MRFSRARRLALVGSGKLDHKMTGTQNTSAVQTGLLKQGHNFARDFPGHERIAFVSFFYCIKQLAAACSSISRRLNCRVTLRLYPARHRSPSSAKLLDKKHSRPMLVTRRAAPRAYLCALRPMLRTIGLLNGPKDSRFKIDRKGFGKLRTFISNYTCGGCSEVRRHHARSSKLTNVGTV